MMNRRRSLRRTGIGTGGVFLISSLIFVVAAIALVAGFVAVRQLGDAAASSRQLFQIQERADLLVRIQLDEETSLRGYLISHQRAFLEPYLAEADPFEDEAKTLRAALSSNGLSDGLVHLKEIVEAHRLWRTRFAQPLIEDPARSDTAGKEAYGKFLDDRIRQEAAALRSEILATNDRVEASLENNIDRTVDYSVGFVLIVALAVIYLALAQRSTQAALSRQHSIAAHLQAALGVGWRAIPGSTIGTAYVSATRGSDVGGDLFDAWPLDERRGAILIADMSGKGIDAVVNTAFCKYSLRALVSTLGDPAAAMMQFNRLFARMVEDPSMFAVAFLGIVDRSTATLSYVSAGHEPAFLRRDGVVEMLQIGGPIVGMEEQSRYTASTVTLHEGDMVILATDGLTEARNTRGELLGAHGAAVLIAAGSKDPRELCEGLIEALRRRGGEAVSDDLALLALRFDGSHRSSGQTSAPEEERRE